MLFDWWRAASADARRAFFAAALGWMLDAFDVTLFAMVLPALLEELHLTKTQGGLLQSVTLVAASIGGLLFGMLADRFGRTRALSWSVAVYSVFTGACGFAQNVVQLGVLRVFLGLGMGGEWSCGAALVSESWPAEHRAKALGFMQSAFAIGYGAAAVVAAVVLPRFGWRAVFFVGVLPALLTFWVQRHVKEPEMWRAAAARVDRHRASPADLFRSGLAGLTVAVTTMNAFALFGWWAFWSWLPSFLTLPVDQGGLGLKLVSGSALIVVMQVGMWLGYASFGYAGDHFGRKPAYIFYLSIAALSMWAYTAAQAPLVLLALGPLVAFFATGHFSGFSAVTAEIYRTEIRATAQGFTYNAGRLTSALAPFAVGSLAQTHGFATALRVAALAFGLAAVVWFWIPETKGRVLA